MDGTQWLLCYNAPDIAFMGVYFLKRCFLNKSHNLLINFKQEQNEKNKEKKAKKRKEKTHSWQQTEADRQLEFHTLNSSTAP